MTPPNEPTDHEARPSGRASVVGEPGGHIASAAGADDNGRAVAWSLRVGCPMWAHRPWVGRFLPPGTRPGEELAAYARLLPAVEGNTTFYALPDARTVAKWAEHAPAEFRFVFKLPKPITHDLRLRNASTELGVFLHRVEPLANRMGPIMVQLPPTFDASGFETLDRFVTRLPSEFEWAVEARHPDYFAGGAWESRLDRMLADALVNRVILDTRALYAGPCETEAEQSEFRTKPSLPVRPVATSKSPIVRFIGQRDADANRSSWQRWVGVFARWLAEGLSPYFFMHTPANLISPALAQHFYADVRQIFPGLAALAAPADPASDASLF